MSHPARSIRARSTRVLGMAASACLFLAIAASAQSLTFPSGDAYSLLRGPSVSLVLHRVSDGLGTSRFVIDAKTAHTQTMQTAITGGGTRYGYSTKFTSKSLGAFEVASELDIVGPAKDGSYDLVVRVTDLPDKFRVQAMGVEFAFKDERGNQHVLIPTFSGGEFSEPAKNIPDTRPPLDTWVANCAQATCYYGDDGTGLMLFGLDPTGSMPKHFVYTAKNKAPSSLAITFEYYPPARLTGGAPGVDTFRTRVLPYKFDAKKQEGWFVGAKLYRAWLEGNATGPGQLLERGRLETRTDVPKWMKELDLFVSEQWGWYPQQSKIPAPLLELRRLKRDLAAKNLLVGLWFSYDRTSELGRWGTWAPHWATALQAQALLPDGIRVTGYTHPGGFDVKNVFLDASGLRDDPINAFNGTPVTFEAGSDLMLNPYTQLRIDVAAKEAADWFFLLGAYHATASWFSGFYADLPMTVGSYDWWRPPGQGLGITKEAFDGFRNLLVRAREGANLFGRDFVTYHEAAFEWLVPAAAMQGAVGVIGRAYNQDDSTRGVPFFQAVYSGYTLFWPADEGLGPQTLTVNPSAYGDFANGNMTRLLAEGVARGNIPNSSELSLATGKLFYEVAVPEPAKSMFLHHRDVLRKIIDLRARARPWLVYGELLADPVKKVDLVDVDVQLWFDGKFQDNLFRMPVIATSAWKAKDDSIRIIAINPGQAAADVEYEPSRIGLPNKTDLIDTLTNKRYKESKNKVRVKFDPGQVMLLEPKS